MRMNFRELSEYFQKIEDTSSRIEMTELLSDLFKELSTDEIDKVIYLMQSRLTPQYVKLDFNLAAKMVAKAGAKAFDMDEDDVAKVVKEKGDVGLGIQELRKDLSVHPEDMSIHDVFEALKKLAEESGTGSQDEKLSQLSQLIKKSDSLSAKYLARIPAGAMRLGFSDMTVLDAFSWMLTGDKSLRKRIQKAFHVMPDLGKIGKILKKEGIEGVDNVKPTIFTPILMMKAQRLPSTQDIVDKVGEGVIEPKYDGFRLQVHVKNKEVRLYSRGLDDVTYMYPDIVEGVKKEIKADEIIFEGEAIGFDEYSGNFLPFQETVQRKRKHGIEKKAKEIPLKMFAFEILYLNGESHLETPLEQRVKLLKENVVLYKDIFKDTILLTPEVIADTVDKIEKEFAEAIEKGLEGIMIKKLDGKYEPGARGWNWIKYKRSHSNKINDTMDCVVMGYDAGKGKRSEFGIGAFLAGVYDQKEDVFKTVAKIGTGLSDDEWRKMKKLCDDVASDKKPALYNVDKTMKVDVWVKPEIVVEIKADEITRSTMHTAGRSGKNAGYALRFPRLERFRDDKTPEDATSVKEVKAMFESQ